MKLLAIAVTLTMACAHAPPAPPVKASNGPVCQGLVFPADAPCLEKGEPAPFGGVLNTPEWEIAGLAERKRLAAENGSLQKSNAVDVGLVGTLIGIAIGLAIAGFELGRATK